MKIGFLVGTPRTGKSKIFDILTSSQSFAWLSEYHYYFNKPRFSSFLNRLYNIPLLGFMLYILSSRFKYLPHPLESNCIWEKYIPYFNEINIESNFKTLSTSQKHKLIRNVSIFIKWQGKKLFLSEYSKWSKINIFNQVFPDSKYVHVIRDGRAIAYEYYKMIIKGNYKEWNNKNEWINVWPEKWRKHFLENYYEDNNTSILAFCVFLWKFQLESIQRELINLPKEQYLIIKYEDFVRNTNSVINTITVFLNLKFNKRMKKYVKKQNLINMNYEWEQNLTEKQKNVLNEVINYLELDDVS